MHPSPQYYKPTQTKGEQMGRKNTPNYTFGVIIGKSILNSNSQIHGYMEDSTLYWTWFKVFTESCTQHHHLLGFYS